MKKQLPLFILLIIIGSNLFSQRIDSEYSYAVFSGFYLRNQNVEGRISGFEGELKFDKSNISSSVINISADISTLNTGYSNRDTTLLGKDFLDAAEYPKIHFQSNEFSVIEKGYELKGDLTIKDKTNEITILFKIMEEDRRSIFKGEFYFNRFDFNIGENISTISVSEEIEVKIHCILKK
jgi:polyisoprenoid-binding protein YceI